MKTFRLLLGCSLFLLCSRSAFAEIIYQGFDKVETYRTSDSCEVTLMRNGVNPAKPERIGRMQFREKMPDPEEHHSFASLLLFGYPPQPQACFEPDVVTLARKQACIVGAKLVNFHTMEHSNSANADCFWATADFYPDTSGFKVGSEPVWESPYIGSRRLDVMLFAEGNALTGGAMSRKHLATSVNLARYSAGLSLRRTFGRFGVLSDFVAGIVRETYTDSAAKDTVGVNVGHEFKFRLGPSVNLLRSVTLRIWMELNLAAGPNFTLEQYSKTFTGGSTTAKNHGGYATGFGWFVKLDWMGFVSTHWSLSGTLLEEYEGPGFSDGSSLSAYSTGMGFNVGYHFGL